MTDDSAPAAPRTLAQRVDAWERLVRLDKPIGTLLLLWPTLTALWIAARGTPPLSVVLIYMVARRAIGIDGSDHSINIVFFLVAKAARGGERMISSNPAWIPFHRGVTPDLSSRWPLLARETFA